MVLSIASGQTGAQLTAFHPTAKPVAVLALWLDVSTLVIAGDFPANQLNIIRWSGTVVYYSLMGIP